MSGSAANTDRVLELAEAVCSKTASRPELAELKSLLLADQTLCRRYVLYCHMHAALRFEMRADRAAQKVCPEIDIRSIAQACSTVEVLDVDAAPNVPPTFLSTSVNSVPGLFSSGWPAAYLIATVIFGIGLVIGALVHVSQPVHIVNHSNSGNASDPESRTPNSMPRASVARITSMVDCVWEGTGGSVQGSGPANQKSAIRPGDRLALRSGLLELSYDSGARVILQGPVTYDVESPAGGYLAIGKLTARLERKSEVRGQRSEVRDQRSEVTDCQFVIRTPTALVTDLGTEFGVEVDKRGGTTSQVFRGLVKVQRLTTDGKTVGDEQVLGENEAVTVANDAGNRIKTLVPTDMRPKFVRELPRTVIKTLDLVDVVAGGNGFSGKRGRGIDPTRGQIVATPSKQAILTGDGRYHRVKGLPFVDGVFVPNSQGGPVQTDSAGNTFYVFGNAFKETSQYIWAGGVIPFNDSRRSISSVLKGVDYSSSNHGLLYMHANKGLTFDLDAIRQANPRDRLVRFRAVVGNTEMPAVLGSNGRGNPKSFLTQDFQEAAVGALPPKAELKSAGTPGSGTWAIAGRESAAQVVDDVGSNANVAVANKYLEILHGWVLATGWDADATDSQIVQLIASIRVSSETDAVAFLNAFAGPAPYENYTFTVYLAADGSVCYYNGRDTVNTGLVSHPDTWQHVTVTANMAAHTFSIKLDDQPLYTEGIWLNHSTRVSQLLIGNNAANGTVCFDDITLAAPASSTLEDQKPERMSANAWVLVDGERRYKSRMLDRASGPLPITVSITEKDRFLTLAATDGGDSYFWDWILFGDPRLEMTPAEGRNVPSWKTK